MILDFKNRIINGDCIDVMRELPENSISACITDPPYNYEFIGKDWNTDEIQRRTERVKTVSSKTLVKNIPYGSGLAGGVRNEAWYKKNRKNTLEYFSWCEKWGAELYRICKPGAIVMIFNSSRTVAQVQVAMENVGFYARDMMVWKRSSGIPKGLNFAKKLEKLGDPSFIEWEGWHSCLRNEWEAICVVQKPLVNNYLNTIQNYGVGLFKAKTEKGFKSNVFENIKRDELSDYNIHCTVKPLALIEELIELVVPKNDNNIVIDPFLGSGTTAVACKRLGINYCGIEINNNYIDIANKRLKENK